MNGKFKINFKLEFAIIFFIVLAFSQLLLARNTQAQNNQLKPEKPCLAGDNNNSDTGSTFDLKENYNNSITYSSRQNNKGINPIQIGQVSDFNLKTSIYADNAPLAPSFWLKAVHPEFSLTAQKSNRQIIEVIGGADSVGPLLNQMELIFTRVGVDDLSQILSDKTRILAIDCCGEPYISDKLIIANNSGIANDTLKPIHRKDWPIIRQWVENGGYLLATDWTLDNFLSQAFPGYLSYQGNNGMANIVQALPKGQYRSVFGQTVNVNSGSLVTSLRSLDVMFLGEGLLVPVSVTGQDPALFNGTRGLPNNWAMAGLLGVQVDGASGLRVLVEPVAVKPYSELGPIACEFSCGKGHVLYLTGHFCNRINNANFNIIRMDLKTAMFTNFIILGLEDNLK